MAESILSNRLFRLITSSIWIVDSFEYNHHYQTGKVIACSVFCHNNKFLKSTGWFYFHEKEFIDGEERGIQFSFTRPFTKGEQLFSVPSSKIILKVFNNSSMQLIIHEILTEGRVRLDLEMKLSGKNNVNLTAIKEFFDNYC